MRYFVAIVLFMSSTVSAQVKTSTLGDFQEYAKRMSGRFSSEITLIHDWPGNKKKKGDVIHGVRHGAIDCDGSALVLTDTAGAGIGKEICAYNAATKQIESFIVFNGGTVFHAVTWKESSDKWNWSVKGSLASGDKISGRGYWKFSDGGKRLELISDDFKIGGKQAGKLHDKYIRVAN